MLARFSEPDVGRQQYISEPDVDWQQHIDTCSLKSYVNIDCSQYSNPETSQACGYCIPVANTQSVPLKP